MSAIERCDQCKFFKLHYEFRDEPALDVFMQSEKLIAENGWTHPDDRTGSCLRFPPVLLLDWVMNIIDDGSFHDGGSEAKEFVWGRPLTPSCEYCGEFKERDK